ncbi:MAG: potassium/proton antiporter [Ilumatobacter sp.]|nr:MAG: potassium/proton antiporter [Ilumatobacter sp.]
MDADVMILAAAALLLGGVLLSKTSSRFGVPSLLLFLSLGMLAGSEGLLGIEFDDVDLARSVGIIALAFILFSGGLSTRWSDIAPVLGPGLALASVGVVVSAVVLGWFATLILELSMLEGMLLGGVIASTDAAAVFSILRSRGVRLGKRMQAMLELESGSNDPAAVFLTVGFISLIETDGTTIADLAGSFVVQMSVGGVAGFLFARAAVFLVNRLRLEFDGLYPVVTFAFVLLVFESVTWVGGSGFLAAYVAGVTMANHDFLHKRSLIRFHDAIAWLMQIGMFVVLGLLVFPSQLLPVAGPALLVAGVLMFVARPLAAFLTLLPFRMEVREITFVSWVGLRGAAPVILATFPVAAGVPNADRIFNVVFFVVLTSVLVQGTTIPLVARRLGLEAGPEAASTSVSFDAVIAGDSHHQLHEVRVENGAPAAGALVVELGLPRQMLILLVRRAGTTLMPEGSTVLKAGDELLVFAERSALTEVEPLFTAPGDPGRTPTRGDEA